MPAVVSLMWIEGVREFLVQEQRRKGFAPGSRLCAPANRPATARACCSRMVWQ